MADEAKIPMANEEDLKVLTNLKRIKHVIVVMSGKGGVGKSTVAANLAVALSMKGYETGLMDVDIHGPNIPKMLKIEDAVITGDKTGLYPVQVPPHLKVMSMAFLLQDRDAPIIWRGPMKMGAIRQFIGDVKWGDLDYLIVDLPPGTGDEPLSIAQLIPKADGSIVVTTPQDVALLDSRKSINFSRSLKLPIIGVIENMSGMVCPHCGEHIDLFKIGGGKKSAEELGVPFLGGVPIDPKVVHSGDDGMPIVLYDPSSQAAIAFMDIVDKITEKLNKKN
jgi:ATP-binding protein involved in chromosome partitioning